MNKYFDICASTPIIDQEIIDFINKKDANPSIPSIKLNAFVNPTMDKIVKGIKI